MGSSSSTSQRTTNQVTDRRQVADNGALSAQVGMGTVDASKNTSTNTSTNTKTTTQTASSGGIGVSNGSGVVNLDVVPGSAFDLAQHALDTTSATLAAALKNTQANDAQVIAATQQAAQTDSNQIAQQMIKIGLPVAALIFIFGKK